MKILPIPPFRPSTTPDDDESTTVPAQKRDKGKRPMKIPPYRPRAFTEGSPRPFTQPDDDEGFELGNIPAWAREHAKSLLMPPPPRPSSAGSSRSFTRPDDNEDRTVPAWKRDKGKSPMKISNHRPFTQPNDDEADELGKRLLRRKSP